jgi:hypothetical protein
MGGLLNSSFLFAVVGFILGYYLGNPAFRAGVHRLISKVSAKNNPPIKPTQSTETKSDGKPKRIIKRVTEYIEEDDKNE